MPSYLQRTQAFRHKPIPRVRFSPEQSRRCGQLHSQHAAAISGLGLLLLCMSVGSPAAVWGLLTCTSGLPRCKYCNVECATPDHEVFHCLHQPALDVPSGGGLDSCVNETLTPSHGVEEQLLHRHSVLRFLTTHMSPMLPPVGTRLEFCQTPKQAACLTAQSRPSQRALHCCGAIHAHPLAAQPLPGKSFASNPGKEVAPPVTPCDRPHQAVRAHSELEEGRIGRAPADLRGEASQVGVLHKTAGLWAEVVLGEVGQGAPLEAKGYALALHVLLPHAGNHLRDSQRASAVPWRARTVAEPEGGAGGRPGAG